jgi:hypothetical protein
MRYWKNRGISIFDWGGEGTYKEKYGCTPHRVPWFTKSRYQIVGTLRNEARNMFARKQKVLGWLQGNRSAGERGVSEEVAKEATAGSVANASKASATVSTKAEREKVKTVQ